MDFSAISVRGSKGKIRAQILCFKLFFRLNILPGFGTTFFISKRHFWGVICCAVFTTCFSSNPKKAREKESALAFCENRAKIVRRMNTWEKNFWKFWNLQSKWSKGASWCWKTGRLWCLAAFRTNVNTSLRIKSFHSVPKTTHPIFWTFKSFHCRTVPAT